MVDSADLGTQKEDIKSVASWKAIVIDDDPNVCRDISEYFADHNFGGRPIAFAGIQDWNQAFDLIRARKADLIILDVYRGEARMGGDRIGERVLQDIRESGFAPVVIYTNLTEGMEPDESEFVRLVLKADGLKRLEAALNVLFDTRLPHMNRAIVNHMDRALRDYMWGFVTENWPTLKTVADKPEFLRLLLQRLALSFVRDGVSEAVAEVFGSADQLKEGGIYTVHPAELYLKPPIGPDPLLGDIRVRRIDDKSDYLVVLWPSCDMVSAGGRKPKTNTVLCARGLLLDGMPEVQKYHESKSNTAKRQLSELLKNNRDPNFGTSDRFHFLPGFLDIPNLVVDFQDIERQKLDEVTKFECLGSLTSPYAEHLASRFTRYLGRIGTPDTDLEIVIASLGIKIPVLPGAAPPKTPTAVAATARPKQPDRDENIDPLDVDDNGGASRPQKRPRRDRNKKKDSRRR